MRGVCRVLAIVVLGVGLFTTIVSADIHSGKKIYIKKLKPQCGMSSAMFARMHTQDEWEAIKEAGKLGAEIKKICPASTLDAKYEGDIYDFLYAYAKDSGNIPIN